MDRFTKHAQVRHGVAKLVRQTPKNVRQVVEWRRRGFYCMTGLSSAFRVFHRAGRGCKVPILAKYFEHITRHIVLEQEKLERSSLENLGTHVVDGTFDFVLLQMCRACSLCMQTRLQCMHPLGCLQRKAAKNKFTQGRLTPERTRDVATPLSRSKSLARRFDFARHSPPTCHVSDFEDYMTCLDSVGGVCHPPRLVSASTTALVLNFAGELLGSHG